MYTMFGNADPMQQNANSFEAENAQHNLLLLVNLVIKVNDLISRQHVDKKSSMVFKKLFEIICNAWEEQTYKLSNALWNTFKHCGGTDLLIKNNCASEYEIVQFSSDRLVEKSQTETNDYILKNVEEKFLRIVPKDKTQVSSLDIFKFNFRIFENLFKQSDITFIDPNELVGLGVLLDEWRRRDFVSLKQTLNALFNLWRPHGCPKHKNCMIKHNIHTRFFTLMFKTEDNVKNYIAILVTDNEIRTAIIKRKIPTEIFKFSVANVRCQSQICMEKCTPVFNSNSEETSKASKARIKKQLDKTSIFGAINVIKPLEKVIVNNTASELRDQSSRLTVEEVPNNRLNMCVHQWSAEEVHRWFKPIGLTEFADNLLKNRVDGDLLLRLTIDELRNEIGILNGIMKKRFVRELNNLKQSADYSSIDTTDLNSFLKSINLEYSVYTYPMLIAGVTRDSMRFVTDDQLKNDCGISNGVHRSCIITSIKEMPAVYVENINKHCSLSVYISYNRSTDSLLASLIKVHLKIRGYNNVFLDVKRSNDAESRNNVLQTIRQTQNFIVVLTPGSLDKQLMNSPARDIEHFDVIREEVTTAREGQCNIIPVLDKNFSWPPPALIPDDMKHLCEFNSIRWVHDYQDACVDKLETFMNQF
ncbi:sterile alpha and TIR motif-containing protein 1-like [Myzus persicae]|uniref:sterile alpha and TIR motif-containing protein 1-like n=1 Tax=Myzus persicae TaxID=13164 RepID=UPI000B9353E6|nr:sterile alpha and TIR motif-containing protein 1-like [Myzus persicae]